MINKQSNHIYGVFSDEKLLLEDIFSDLDDQPLATLQSHDSRPDADWVTPPVMDDSKFVLTKDN